MTKSVRTKVGRPLGQSERAVDDASYHPRVDTFATLAEEHRWARVASDQLRPRPREPSLDRTHCRHTDRDSSFLAALAEHSHHAALPIKIINI
jgi:hypothetical protein